MTIISFKISNWEVRFILLLLVMFITLQPFPLSAVFSQNANVTISVKDQQTNITLDSVLVRMIGLDNAVSFEGYTDPQEV